MASRAGCGVCSVRLCSWRFMSCCCTCLPSSPTSSTTPPAAAAAAAATSTCLPSSPTSTTPPAAAAAATSITLLPQITLEQLEALIPILELEVKRLDPTYSTASSSSSQAPPVSESLKNMLAQWEDQKQICISFVDSIPKQLTDEVVGTTTSLFMSILTNALSGAGGLQWLGVGFTFIAWSLDNISNIIQNREDCIEILRRSFRLLRHTKEIWQATNIGNTTRNEDLQDSVGKAFRCAIFCTSSLTDNCLLRILKATTVKDGITMFAEELDRANIQNIEFMVRHNLTNKLERQITYHISNDGIVGGQEVIQKAVTYLDTSSDDIMAIGLHGMGGVGKSFLGLKIFAQFQKSKYRNCRVELQPETKQGDLCGIQKQILEKVCKHDIPKFSNLTDGKQIMEKELKRTVYDPIFLYVDNVLDYRFVTELLPKASFFPKGSRILMTSREEYIGRGIEDLGITNYRLIEVRKLQKEQAQQLLWEQLKSKGEHRDVSEVESLEERVLKLCDGLPLALTIVGKYIAYGNGLKKVEIWRQVVDDMQKAQPFGGSENDGLYSRIVFSIHNLHPNVKAAFLDIIFLLDAPGVYLANWESAELLVSKQNLEVLCQRALVRKNLRERVAEIHDVLKAMGKRMVENDEQELRITGMDKFEELHMNNVLKNVVALDHVTVDAHLLKQMPLLRLLKDVVVRGEGQNLIQLRQLRVVCGLRCTTARAFDWSKCGSLKEVFWGNAGEELDDGEAAAPNVSNLQEVFKQDKISMRFESLTLYDWSQLKDVDLIETLTCLQELQLCYCREIESLPEGIATLTGLKMLVLRGCKKLKGLPQGISSLSCLEVLDLGECESFQSLPEGISSLTCLNELDLSGCKRLQGLPQGISSLRCLEVLRLKDCESIQSLPEGISRLTGLSGLHLWGCKRLKGLPQGISSLRCLEVLDLDDCESVQSLPDGLTSLTGLRELYLSGCQSLQSIPEGIGNLRKVNGFPLWRCASLESIPEGAVNLMSGLTQLSLVDCYKLKYLPDGITRLTGLKSLDLRECRSLRSLPEGVSGLTGLNCLLLAGCKMLQAVPDGIASLSGLNEIDLSWCKALKSLPKELSCLPCLTSLKLAGCRNLQALPEKLGFMTGFRKLDLVWCESLQFLPHEISKLTGLVHLDLYGCKSLQSIQGVTTLTALRFLDLRNCTQLQLLPEGCTRLTSLRHIYLSGCTSLKSIPELATLGHSQYRSPKEEEEAEEDKEEDEDDEVEVNSLYLSGCGSLKSLPQSIGSFTLLQRLDLANCTSLESLPEGVTRLSNLAKLSLLGCKSLRCLPRGLFGSLTGLTELNLRDCALLTQPLLEEISWNMTNLKVLDLSGCEDLQSLPQGITSLMGLETLSLFKCKNFQLLPKGMANWTGLTRLVLSGCQSLQSVPEELITLTALSHLELSKCASLRSLPQRIFTSLGGLEVLSMSGCGGLQLEESQGITRLAGLRRLHLSESEHLLFLLSEQQGLSSLTCLKELYLSRCGSLRSLPGGVAALTYLDRVKLSGCASLQSLSNLPQGSTCLSWLHLGGCGSLDQPAVWERIMSFKCLKYLNLSGWETMQALPEGIASVESLTELDLSKCSSLLSLPESVMNLTNLRVLRLEDCKSLERLRPEITRMVSLNVLDLSGCTSLESLPEEITLWMSGMWDYRPCLQHESSPQ